MSLLLFIRAWYPLPMTSFPDCCTHLVMYLKIANFSLSAATAPATVDLKEKKFTDDLKIGPSTDPNNKRDTCCLHGSMGGTLLVLKNGSMVRPMTYCNRKPSHCLT